MMLNSPEFLKEIDFSWALFLDRDGVINHQIPGDYVSSIESFSFKDGALEAIRVLSDKFGITVVVTNQQGIGKGVMTVEQLNIVHNHMQEKIEENSGKIDKIYYAPALAKENSDLRKPNTGMGLAAQNDFSRIDFAKSVMVGDSGSDIEFGKRLGMYTVHIGDVHEECSSNICCSSLIEFAQMVKA